MQNKQAADRRKKAYIPPKFQKRQGLAEVLEGGAVFLTSGQAPNGDD